MRLIDADALKETAYDGRGWKNASEGFHQMVVDIEDIDDAPTIDAIPVEWLEKMAAKKDSCIFNPYWFVLKTWQNEQEEE